MHPLPFPRRAPGYVLVLAVALLLFGPARAGAQPCAPPSPDGAALTPASPVTPGVTPPGTSGAVPLRVATGATIRCTAFPAPVAAHPHASPRTLEEAYIYSSLGTVLPLVVLAGGVTSEGGNHPTRWAAIAVGVAGAVGGPSAGHLYLGAPERALVGSGLRVLGGAVGAGTILLGYRSDNLGLLLAGGLIVIGGYAVGTTYDFVTLSSTARARGVALVPSVDATMGAPTASLVVRF